MFDVLITDAENGSIRTAAVKVMIDFAVTKPEFQLVFGSFWFDV